MIYENEMLQGIEPQLAENFRRYFRTRSFDEKYNIKIAFHVFGYFFTKTEIALIFTLHPETCNDAKQLIPTLVERRETYHESWFPEPEAEA